jgi:hypothetical protein
MKKATICILFSVLVCAANAQCLTAFKDTRAGSDRLYIYDNGQIAQQEYKVNSFSVGRTMIAYRNSASEFKVYKNGQTQTLRNISSSSFSAGDDFVFYGFRIFDGTKFYEKCELEWNDEYSLLEDTTDYANRRKAYLERYCADDIFRIYDKLFDDTVRVRKFNDGSYSLIYRREFVKMDGEPASFETNKTVAAFVDEYDYFKAFYKGEIFSLEDDAPEYYKTGEDFIAFVSSADGGFKAFYEGSVYPLLSDAPKSYFIHKDLLVYFDLSDHLHVFNKGKSVKLANYHPEEIKTDRGILVFKDLDNRLQGFIDGKQQAVSTEVVSDFTVNNKAVVFYKNPPSAKVFCNGKTVQAY